MIVETGINDSTVWRMINESATDNKAINFRSVIMDNVRDTLEMNSVEDCIYNGYDIRDTLNDDDDLCNEFMERVVKRLDDSKIEKVEFSEKDWNECYRDMNVTLDIEESDILNEMENDGLFIEKDDYENERC